MDLQIVLFSSLPELELLLCAQTLNCLIPLSIFGALKVIFKYKTYLEFWENFPASQNEFRT